MIVTDPTLTYLNRKMVTYPESQPLDDTAKLEAAWTRLREAKTDEEYKIAEADVIHIRARMAIKSLTEGVSTSANTIT